MNLVNFYQIPIVYFNNQELWVDLTVCGIIYNKYEISTFGNIRHKDTKILINKHIINSGYETVNLACYDINGEYVYKTFLVHRLVALTFVYNQYIERNTVNHNDCNQLNNKAYNLSWMTQKENNEYKYTSENGNGLLGEKIYNSRVTDEQVHIICKMLEEGHRYKDILMAIGIDPPSDPNDNLYDLITNIKRGISWKHISKNYDIKKYKYIGSKNFNEFQINEICKMLENGKSMNDICQYLYNRDYLGSYKDKNFYEFIRRIKKGEQFANISKKYNIK